MRLVNSEVDMVMGKSYGECDEATEGPGTPFSMARASVPIMWDTVRSTA